MSGFDQATRTMLQGLVGRCRDLLEDDYRRQIQRYGISEKGAITSIADLGGNERHKAKAERLQTWLEHLIASEPAGSKQRQHAAERLVREAAFTTFNRLVALRLCEERQVFGRSELVANGMQSRGFRLFESLIGSGISDRYERYRLYLDRVCDDLAVDLGALFNPRQVGAILWPEERTFADLIDELKAEGLTNLWSDDETIGWIYQYFNSQREIKRMRNQSQRPRNSREMAVRNQFFTPRYVVEYLVDNTLGRLWYEMRHGETSLVNRCRYLIHRPAEQEMWLAAGEAVPADLDEAIDAIPHVARKDPRDLRIMDPACGSGHFLLYCFDLLIDIYEEAWHDERQVHCKLDGTTLREAFPQWEDCQRALPQLIVEHNLYGVDIDPRAAQIAQLALWLRAHKAWNDAAIPASERPRISNRHIVCAQPMPGEQPQFEAFCKTLSQPALAPVLETVFEAMAIAGEAGSLLNVNDILQDALREAQEKWTAPPKPQQASLSLADPEPEQGDLLDPRNAPPIDFWENTAEHETLDSLHRYIAESDSVTARLFAQDLERGLDFVDICHLKFDVVVMNPPFGEFAKPALKWAKDRFPVECDDIGACFVSNFTDRLRPRGRIGIISSRTIFFTSAMSEWRKNTIMSRGAPDSFVDLGEKIMDNATVEAAAYVLSAETTTSPTDFHRVLGLLNREEELVRTIEKARGGSSCCRTYRIRTDAFSKLWRQPFAYWVNPQAIKTLTELRLALPEAFDVRQGLVTGDAKRYVRAIWESPPDKLETYGRTLQTTGKWYPYVMKGSSQPWYSPLTVAVNWADNGAELRNYVDKKGNLRSRPRAMPYYFRPGFSWTQRAARFIPYTVASGAISSGSRYMAYPIEGDEYKVPGIIASNVCSAVLRFNGEWFARPKFFIENLKALFWPEAPEDLTNDLKALVDSEVARRRRAYQNHEPFHDFVAPSLVYPNPDTDALTCPLESFLGAELEARVAAAYGFSPDEADALCRDLREAIAYNTTGSAVLEEDEPADAVAENQEPHEAEEDAEPDESASDDENEDDGEFLIADDEPSRARALISYAVGVAFGRWDVRMAVDHDLIPAMAGPFDHLPQCPPGMLVGPDALPATEQAIASEEWLQARPNAITPPTEGSVETPSIASDAYPVRVAWQGCLGLYNDDRTAYDRSDQEIDLNQRVDQVFGVLFEAEKDARIAACCEALGVDTLRAYLANPNGFFADHYKTYTKSGRIAPIYWPLATTDGSFTAWCYLHRMSDQTLAHIMSELIDPALRRANSAATNAEQQKASTEGRARKQFEDAQQRAQDSARALNGLRDQIGKLDREGYRPCHDDGVMIAACPLHELISHRDWRTKLADNWAKLEAGDLDWAHTARLYWTERVEDQCITDRSLAIAHGLEDRCTTPDAREKQAKRGAKKAAKKSTGKKRDSTPGQASLFDGDTTP